MAIIQNQYTCKKQLCILNLFYKIVCCCNWHYACQHGWS